MKNYNIREIKTTELHHLETFLYEAIFQPENTTPLPRDVIHQPELKLYIEDFGKSSDECLVAETGGKIVGAVWTRLWNSRKKGFGYTDQHTPELTISVLKSHRSKGIGRSLMQAMLQHLKTKGYTRASLSVQKANYAVQLYTQIGFEVIEEKADDYIMAVVL